MAHYKGFRGEIDAWYSTGDAFDWRGSQIFFQQKGAGPVLLMVHGFPTAGCDWLDMVKELADHFTIVAPDIADAGHSTNPAKKTFTLHEHADMLEALLQYLNIGEVHLIGHDVGDAICQELIARQNESALSFRVESCVFLNGGILMTAHRPLGLQSMLAGKFGWLVARLMRKKTFMNNINAIFGDRKVDRQVLEVLWEVSKSVNGRPSLARRSHNMIDRHQHAVRWVKALQETPIKMCMINGIEDPISGGHVCDAIERELPHISVIRLPGVGHFPLIESPEQCVKHALQFHRKIGTFKDI